MAALIIPSRRVWQPQGAVNIDGGNKLSIGLREALTPIGSHLFYAMLGRPIVFAGAIQPVVTSGQFGAGNQNAGLSGAQAYIGAVSIASDATLAVVGRVPSNASNSTVASVGQNASGKQLLITIGNGTTAGVVRAEAYIGGGNRVFGGSFTLPVGSDYIAIARHKNGVLQDLWVNGVRDPATLSQTGNFIGITHFGRQGAIVNTPLFLAATWRRALSDQEIREFNLNPWQLFRPVQRRVYFDMGAGGGTSPVSSDSAASYAIRGEVSSDQACAYAIRSSVNADLSASYNIQTASAVSSDLSSGYEIRTSAQSDVSAEYAIRASVQADSSAAYIVRDAVLSDASASYAVRTSAIADLSAAYEIQTASGVAASLDASYNVRAAVQSDASAAYDLRTAVGATSEHAFMVRGLVSIDLDASYTVDASLVPVYADMQAAYLVDGGAVFIPSQFVASVPAGVFSARTPDGDYSATVPAGNYRASI